MTAPKLIILEDTGERRYPKRNEIYVCLSDDPLIIGQVETPRDEIPLEERISSADYYDDEWFGEPEDFAIYRIVETMVDA
jgi:hypothetical protein